MSGANGQSVQVQESEEWGAVVDPFEFLRDDPTFGIVQGQANLRRDRERGKNAPLFETETQLAIFRAVGRTIYDCSEWGKNVGEQLLNYVVGNGFQWRVVPKLSQAANAAAQRLAAIATDALQAVLDANDWMCDCEDEFLLRAVRDGEVFVAVMDGPGGLPALRFVEPAQVTEPPPGFGRALEAQLGLPTGDWSFGVHTAVGDAQQVLGYFVRWSEEAGDCDYLPASRVLHWKRNVDRNVKRGLSDFYPTRKSFRSGRKLLNNMSEGAAIQAAIAWIQQLPAQTSSAQAASVASANRTATTTIPATGTGGSASTRSVGKFPPGSVITTRAGVEYKPGPLGAERNAGFEVVLQAAVRTIGVRWAFPEFLISGDASNANYASTLAAASPFGRARSRDQFKVGRQQIKLWWAVLRVLYGRGAFAGLVGSFAEMQTLVDVTYTAPPVEVQNAAEAVTVAGGKVALGVPRETVLQELGYEPEDLQETAAVGDGGEGVTTATSGAPPTAAPAAAAMSPQEISSLLEIVDAVVASRMPLETARAVVRVSFPALQPDAVEALLGPLATFAPQTLPDGSPNPTASQSPPAPGELSALSRLQFKRNTAAIMDILNRLISGEYTQVQASALLQGVGLSETRSDALIADALDNGRVDDADVAESAAWLSSEAAVAGVLGRWVQGL